MAKKFEGYSDLGILIHRRRLLNQQPENLGFYESARRILLQTENLKIDVMVAGDGSGDVMTVNEAAAMGPKKNLKCKGMQLEEKEARKSEIENDVVSVLFGLMNDSFSQKSMREEKKSEKDQ